MDISKHYLTEKESLLKAIRDAVVNFQVNTGMGVTKISVIKHYSGGALEPESVLITADIEG